MVTLQMIMIAGKRENSISVNSQVGSNLQVSYLKAPSTEPLVYFLLETLIAMTHIEHFLKILQKITTVI